MAEESDKSLQGASLGTWYAPAITSAALQSDDQWSRESLAAYLASGHADNGATAAGPMLEAIDKSFSRMTPDDRAAIATYLLPAVDHEDDSTDADADSEEPTVGLTPVTGDDTPDMLSDMTDGEQIYRNNCASCHNLEGQGLNGLPALTKHPVLEKPNADNVAMVILDGVWPAKGQGMLSFAKTLNDTQIADVTNYVMQDIGNSAVRITPARVKALRQGGEPSLLLPLVRGRWSQACWWSLGAVLVVASSTLRHLPSVSEGRGKPDNQLTRPAALCFHRRRRFSFLSLTCTACA